MILLKMLLEQAPSSKWSMCKAWKEKGISYWNGEKGRPKIDIQVNEAGFRLSYEGPASGYNISHAANSTGDTLHQAFNVMHCECNDYLIRGGVKPDIKKITTNVTRKGSIYKLNIWIPFTQSEGTWLISRRGGMGHDPGARAVLKAVGKVSNLEGPVRVVTGSITEYFVTFSTSKVSATDAAVKPDSNSDAKSADTWYSYPEDKLYTYQQRGSDWYAKHRVTGDVANISNTAEYKSSVDKLNAAKEAGKLTAVK